MSVRQQALRLAQAEGRLPSSPGGEIVASANLVS